MITREEYNAALDIIEEYHKQIQLKEGFSQREKTTIQEFILETDCSVRLGNSLLIYRDDCIAKGEKVRTIEELRMIDLRRIRGMGKKTLNEFIEIRGY